VPGEAGRDRAVEEIDAHPDPDQDVVDLADAKQVTRVLVGQQRDREAEDGVHLRLLPPERAADRDPVDGGRAVPLR
jgi:hypothetical protein